MWKVVSLEQCRCDLVSKSEEVDISEIHEVSLKFVLHGVGSGPVSDRSAIARHEASFFKLVEWFEQLDR